ncbi:cellulase family glycosylhydrolase [Pseudochryseolinea flava]|nr:cellulase family glycosylhydrolase [Pseudochryseolinea flava]
MKEVLRGFQMVVFCLLIAGNSIAQKTQDVYVDKAGVMRWGSTKQEVYGFGVNYTAPFAHAYRSAKKLNVDIEKAIEQDVYHFARLGFDAFRIHVWDTEISDSLGNLLDNEHFRLFDFMLNKMKQRGIKIFLTPIAFWGNGYPDMDEKTPGFSHKYGKDACLVNEAAIRAQENYLYQFLNHVNPETGVAYKNDPDIVGFEISNEPHHRGTPAEVEKYINRMVSAMRKTGCKKPILYNVSHSIHLGETYFKSNIDGGTFQWYPTGLGAQHELRGNFLPNVDRYVMPFDNVSAFKSKVKVVYEFDAADVGRSYIYPAMARSFREAGIQWATHFAYDPTFLAYANTEYNTHYMNLLYAPQKALSLKIAGEVFHQVPRYKKYGAYPTNTKFDGFRVSYEEDLAEYNSESKFFYTNTTPSVPVNTSKLKHIAGYGNSNVVKYEGEGAYFLDQLEAGVWRLEVYPDAVWVDNIFGKNNLNKEVAVLHWNEWTMEVNLPDLGSSFSLQGIQNNLQKSVDGKAFAVTPGVYILAKKGSGFVLDANARFKNITVGEYGAVKSTLKKSYLVHDPLRQVIAGKDVTIKAQIVTNENPDSVLLYVDNGGPRRALKMSRVSGYTYEAHVAAKDVSPGYLNYCFGSFYHGALKVYPSGTGSPLSWSFDGDTYSTAVVATSNSLYVFNAATDAKEVSKEWRKGSKLIPTADQSVVMYQEIPKLFVLDEENLEGQPLHDYSLRYNFKPNVAGRKDELSSFKKMVIKAHSVDADFPLQVALVDNQGNTYGALIALKQDVHEYEIAFENLQPVKHVTLPRPYPTFQQYFFQPDVTGSFDVKNAETLQISVGPGLDAKTLESSYKFGIESIRFEK